MPSAWRRCGRWKSFLDKYRFPLLLCLDPRVKTSVIRISDSISEPADPKGSTVPQPEQPAAEIRSMIETTVNGTGGHLHWISKSP